MAILVASSMCAPVSATLANTEPMTVVRQYVDAFNKGDADAMAANCAEPTSVLDGLAPHVWRGRQLAGNGTGTCAGEREGATGYFITLCKPRHVDVSDARAYVVVPATMMFEVHGEQVTQSSSTSAIGRALRPAMSFG